MELLGPVPEISSMSVDLLSLYTELLKPSSAFEKGTVHMDQMKDGADVCVVATET